ncbi:MAG: class I SAM-dependent methyltransferase [Myxococcota bacterium]|nr:class I SAM-dependent methyltransferase [Myxococcota bacterium]
MPAKLETLVERAAAAHGTSVGPEALVHIGAWLARIEEWNSLIDLTAARSREELVDIMLADALLLAQRVSRDARVVDVGSGAGAPGVPLALLRTDLRVTLVEPLGKRASFLRLVLGVVRRADVVIERARGEAFAGRRQWDTAVSRATLPPATWLDLGTQLTAIGGLVWVLLAKSAPPAHPRATLETDLSYVWPLTGAARRAVAYRVHS